MVHNKVNCIHLKKIDYLHFTRTLKPKLPSYGQNLFVKNYLFIYFFENKAIHKYTTISAKAKKEMLLVNIFKFTK